MTRIEFSFCRGTDKEINKTINIEHTAKSRIERIIADIIPEGPPISDSFRKVPGRSKPGTKWKFFNAYNTWRYLPVNVK